MFEIIVAIIVLICIIYLFKGDFFRKKVVVTVVENLPLAIFRKNNRDESDYNFESQNRTSLKEDEKNNYKAIDEEVKLDKEDILEQKETGVLDEVASDIINNDIEEEKEEEIVYWTPKGKTYHVKSTCRTLARSKVIHSGTVYESGKEFKCENCK